MSHRYPFTRRARVTIGCFIALFFLYGCALPKIIILNDPLSAEEHSNLGRIYQSQGKFDLAAQQYRDALKKDPKLLPALLLLGDLSFQTKKYSEAESAYQKAIKLQPENGDIYNNLCWVYLEQNVRIDKAEELIRTAITVAPEHRAYYLDTMGMVLLRRGRIAESITALKEAAALLPKDNAAYLVETYVHLAEAYRTAGDTATAREAEQSAEKYRAQK
jgi:tetratricopeptide (TPR) repeat protein